MDKVQTRLRVRNQLGRALLGEFLGTFLLVLIIACVCAQAVLPKPALNQTIGVNLGVGLGIAFGVAVCAKVSGGEIGPNLAKMKWTNLEICNIEIKRSQNLNLGQNRIFQSFAK